MIRERSVQSMHCHCKPVFRATRKGKRRRNGRMFVFHERGCPMKSARRKLKP